MPLAVKNLTPLLESGPEEFAKNKSYIEGEFSEKLDAFLHKKDVNKTKVFGKSGFLQTLIFEDDYEYIIKDNYYAIYDGIVFVAGVRYKGDKDEVTFEDLEGRRHYLIC